MHLGIDLHTFLLLSSKRKEMIRKSVRYTPSWLKWNLKNGREFMRYPYCVWKGAPHHHHRVDRYYTSSSTVVLRCYSSTTINTAALQYHRQVLLYSLDHTGFKIPLKTILRANAKIRYTWSIWAKIRYILKRSKTRAPRAVFCPWKAINFTRGSFVFEPGYLME